MANIITICNEGKRGCGYRKPGGKYLMSGGPSVACCKLPHELDVCPCCGAGIKPSRGWTWIDPRPIFGLQTGIDEGCTKDHSGLCPLSDAYLEEHKGEKMGLLWIGGRYYKKPEDWTKEAMQMGVSRRISQIPRDFKLGKTWVLVAHREHDTKVCPDCDGSGNVDTPTITDALPRCEKCKGKGVLPVAAIFHAFKPERIEYIIKGDETEKELERMEKQGITLVKLVRDEKQEAA